MDFFLHHLHQRAVTTSSPPKHFKYFHVVILKWWISLTIYEAGNFLGYNWLWWKNHCFHFIGKLFERLGVVFIYFIIACTYLNLKFWASFCGTCQVCNDCDNIIKVIVFDVCEIKANERLSWRAVLCFSLNLHWIQKQPYLIGLTLLLHLCLHYQKEFLE